MPEDILDRKEFEETSQNTKTKGVRVGIIIEPNKDGAHIREIIVAVDLHQEKILEK